MPNLGEGSKFLRAYSAQQVGINRSFAMACSVPGADPCGQAWRLCQHAQAFSHKLMVAEAMKGEAVVRIKGGDPFVFGRGGDACDALRAAGVAVQVVSGLTAGLAGPAALGIPVTDRCSAPGVALVTGTPREGAPGPTGRPWPAAA